MHELNIGHAIIARAVFVGLQEAVREMKELIGMIAGRSIDLPGVFDRVQAFVSDAHWSSTWRMTIVAAYVTPEPRTHPLAMPTKGEAFAGLSVAIVTPFRNDEVDYPALKAQIEFQIAAGTTCICPVGTTGESPTLSHEEHERVVAASVEYANKRHQSDARHRLQQHARSPAADQIRGQARGRCRAGRGPVLQQAHAGRFLSALQSHLAESGRSADLRLQHPRPHGQEHRAGNYCPHGRTEEHHDGERSDRLAGSGVANYRLDRI